MDSLLHTQQEDWLSQSWHRSQQAGLDEQHQPEHVRLDKTQLEQRQHIANVLIKTVEQLAVPLFNQMFAGTNSRLLLTDTEGVIIGSWGQSRFEHQLTGIALESGVCWQESLKGTNAIGTALAEKRFVAVIGDQHFIRKHRFISCSASPICTPDGELQGVLDITSEQQIHSQQTQLLIQNMVQAIENSLLCQVPEGKYRVDLAFDQHLLNSGWQGIVIANQSGHIVAHNAVAARLLSESLLEPTILGCNIDHIIQAAQSSFISAQAMNNKSNDLVFRCQSIQPVKNLCSVIYSPSCPLHMGDDVIEQAWQQACKLINKDVTLLILGETGVGKGEFIKQLHQYSSRNQHPLVAVNCGALPQDLIESELFGYAPGAFTGASKEGYQGKVRQAHKGILFLDEIADMPLSAQCRLLHVLQEKEVVPVGSNEAYKVDIQIVAATHKSLAQLVELGEFRQDLYYRLNGLIVTLPPLRERQDKAELIVSIHAKHAENNQSICSHLIRLLTEYSWPGNIRELDNTLRVASLLSDDAEQLTIEHFPNNIVTQLVSNTHQNLSNTAVTKDLKSTVEDVLLETYHANQGNISKTSRMLSISRNTLYRKLKKLGIM